MYNGNDSHNGNLWFSLVRKDDQVLGG